MDERESERERERDKLNGINSWDVGVCLGSSKARRNCSSARICRHICPESGRRKKDERERERQSRTLREASERERCCVLPTRKVDGSVANRFTKEILLGNRTRSCVSLWGKRIRERIFAIQAMKQLRQPRWVIQESVYDRIAHFANYQLHIRLHN